VIPVVMLVLLGVTLVFGSGLFLANRRLRKVSRVLSRPQKPRSGPDVEQPDAAPALTPSASFIQRPASWLVIRSRNLHNVQNALGLQHVKPCTWTEGLLGDAKAFVAPPVNGWVLVIGSRLPDPADDVDICYRFLQELSRKLGHVQLFTAIRVLGQHAWVRMDGGRVTRAYAWAGHTLWNQGPRTRAEIELGMHCFPYLESPEHSFFSLSDVITLNTEKVPLLASRWSFDPATVDERNFEQVCGVAGEPSRLY
jgi:hypothetical protein